MGEMTIEMMLERIAVLASGMGGFAQTEVDVKVRRVRPDMPWRVSVNVEAHVLGQIGADGPTVLDATSALMGRLETARLEAARDAKAEAARLEAL